MEQVHLTRIAGAQTTLDAALYDFDRASLRDALLAAHAHGVQIRIVTDDAARANPSYASYYDALATAGIPVVGDQDV
jgi:phosphatidylserine/phosphatidylglycerophosphate/cardiolipin synthase-like enzyme